MDGHEHTNLLIHETSPYLMQHAHNPVDWHPWGEAAMERARRQDRPIFLSIGYSTCYWCHVMERESFENKTIAQELNAHFVNVKVDREERPDLDQLYMTAVQLLTRSGGWPMSLFLTPDGRPFYAGTYFPPDDLAGRPGFPTIIKAIDDAWLNRRQEVYRGAEQLVDTIATLSLPGGTEMPLTLDQAWIDGIVARSIRDYDPESGGFGSAPKFPRETLLKLLLSYCRTAPAETSAAPAKVEIRKMLAHTLDRMARGGIRDQLGGGFHRYSTDRRWLVPHFEIMLYDNALLLEVYAQAAKDLQRPDFAEVARGIAEFVLGEMAGPEGAFHTAFDAEVDGREGETYLWTLEEVLHVLGEPAGRRFAKVYGFDRGPNFADPHHGSGVPDKNVLYMPAPLPQVAEELKMSADALKAEIAHSAARLLAARKKRKQPMLDTKVLTSWNAMMARALSAAGRLLDEPRYVQAAQSNAEYLLMRHRLSDGGISRSARPGETQIPGFLEDYASLADALLELATTTDEPRWKHQARKLVQQMRARFASPAGAMYFTDAAAQHVFVRQSVATDSPTPSGNAMAANALLALGETEAARQIIAAFADAMDQQGEAYSALAESTLAYLAEQGALSLPARDVASELQSLRTGLRSAVSATLHRAGNGKAQVRVQVASGYHVNGPEVPKGLRPTRVYATTPDTPTVTYPPTHVRLPLGDEMIDVYRGEFIIEIADLPDAAQLMLETQPCSGAACLQVLQIALYTPRGQ